MISSFTLNQFLPGEVYMNENIFLTEIYNRRRLHLLSIRNYAEHLIQF